MEHDAKRCTECGKAQPARSHRGEPAVGRCAACGASLDDGALSEFASRLARFGLGATREPLLGRLPELPDAK